MQIIKDLHAENLSIKDGKILYRAQPFYINTGTITAPFGYDGARGILFDPSPVIKVLEEWLVNYGTYSFMRGDYAYGILSDGAGIFNHTGEYQPATMIDLPFTGILLLSVSANGALIIQQVKVKQSKTLPDGWTLDTVFSGDNTASHHESDDLPDEYVLDDEDHMDREDSHYE